MKIAMTLSLPSSLLATAGSTTGWRSSAAGPMQAMPLRFSVSLSSSPLQVVFILCHLPFLLLSFSECDLELTPARKGWLSAILFVGMMIGGRLNWSNGCSSDLCDFRRIHMGIISWQQYGAKSCSDKCDVSECWSKHEKLPPNIPPQGCQCCCRRNIKFQPRLLFFPHTPISEWSWVSLNLSRKIFYPKLQGWRQYSCSVDIFWRVST